MSGSVVSLSSLNPFQGQVQLLLFNGEQWGLWNVRGSSDTMFIGSFLRLAVAAKIARSVQFLVKLEVNVVNAHFLDCTVHVCVYMYYM